MRRTVVTAAAILVACTPAPAERTDAPSTVPSIATTAVPTTFSGATTTPTTATTVNAELEFEIQTYSVPSGSRPHDVAPAADGGVWYTAQRRGALGWLDPVTGEARETPLGSGSAPHGVIVGPDGAPWITDGGLNAIVRVDPTSLAVETFPLPTTASSANLNTAAFDGDGILWFTGQAGWYGRLDRDNGAIEVFPSPRGSGPYGITATPGGDVYFSSLAGSYLGAIDRSSGAVEVIDPPTPGAGLRRVWSDSDGRLWVSEWNVGQVGVYDPRSEAWVEWRLPGDAPQAYSVFVDEEDAVWLTDFGANAIVRFEPQTESFLSFPSDFNPANVRQMLGRPGEVWGAESAADRLVVIRSLSG
ncbi:MAG TPA: lyase [Acidimicrobiia bacterium]|nr:lyase [Acidimicrobiia bacterium]